MEKPFPAYKGCDPYIFVSYSHADEGVVFPEIRWLQDQGINVWYDTTGIGPGSEWNDEIAKAIKGADRFLYFVTPSSVASEHCRRELNFAQSENRRVAVCHLQETTLPDGLRLSLDNRQAILRHQLSPTDCNGHAVYVPIFQEFYGDPRYAALIRKYGLDPESLAQITVPELPF